MMSSTVAIPGRAQGSAARRGALVAFFARHELSPAHRRVADVIIDQAEDCIFLSAAALAERVGVSQPSVTRFAQALGFPGYAELQRQLRMLVLPQPASRTPAPNRYQLAVREAVQSLDALDAALADPGELRSLARDLARSVPLVVLSVRVAAPVATYFSYYAARIHPDVRAFSGGGSTTLDGLSQARQAGGRWLVCFLLPRYPFEVVSALSYARECGFRIATVTDRATERIGTLSDVVIAAGMTSRLMFGSLAAPVVYAGVLVQAIADAEPRRTRARLDEYERMVSGQRVFYEEHADPVARQPIRRARSPRR